MSAMQPELLAEQRAPPGQGHAAASLHTCGFHHHCGHVKFACNHLLWERRILWRQRCLLEHVCLQFWNILFSDWCFIMKSSVMFLRFMRFSITIILAIVKKMTAVLSQWFQALWDHLSREHGSNCGTCISQKDRAQKVLRSGVLFSKRQSKQFRYPQSYCWRCLHNSYESLCQLGMLLRRACGAFFLIAVAQLLSGGFG